MKKILNILLWLSAFLVPCAGQVTKISQEPVVSVLVDGDDLLVNTTNSGLGTWTTKRINLANLMASASVTNKVTTVVLLNAASNSVLTNILFTNHTYSGITTWTNNPQIHKPMVTYTTNMALSGTINTVTVTAGAGTFTGWHVGDNFVLSGAEQYSVLWINSSSSITLTSALLSTHTSENGTVYYPDSDIWSDVNGNFFGTFLDDGGCLILADGSGGSPPLISMMYHQTALGGGKIDIVPLAAAQGPFAIIMGGNQGWGSTRQAGLTVSTMAPAYSLSVLSNGATSFEGDLTNILGPLSIQNSTLKNLAEVISPAQSTGPGTMTVSSAGTVTGSSTTFTTTFLNCKVFFIGGQEYHVNQIASDTSMTVYENISATAGSSYTIEPDGLSIYANNVVNKNNGTHLGDAGELTITENNPQINLNSGFGVQWNIKSFGGAFEISSLVNGAGGLNTTPALYIAPNAQFNSLVINSNNTMTVLNGPTVHTGTGSPNSVVTGNPGDLYLNQSGGSATTIYIKESGTGNTGWVGK